MSHALKSASGADTWMLCPGSVRQSRGMVDAGSVYAAEGTAAHALGELCLRTEMPPAAFIGVKHGDHTFTAEMARYVAQYTDAVLAMPGHTLVEVRLDLREWVPPSENDPDGGFGTADAIVLSPDVITINDLKYGAGVKVDAVGNRQLRLYGLGALRVAEAMGFEPKTVVMAVHQPRMDHFDEEALSVEELLAFGEEVKAASAAADNPDAPLVPGEDQCRWCKGKPTCPALVGELVATVPASPALFDDETSVITPPSELTPETLALIYPKLKLLKDWIDACQEHVHALTAAGQMPGYKLVEGRKGNRAWTDADEVEATLKQMKLKVEEMYELKLITPTKAEKLFEAKVIGPRQWPKLQTFISRASGKPSVVPLSDNRPALVLQAPVDAFEIEV